MFRPCILAIFRLYYNLTSNYTICAWGASGHEISSYSNGWHGHTMPPVAVRLYCTVVQPEDGQYTGPKHVVVYPMYYSV